MTTPSKSGESFTKYGWTVCLWIVVVAFQVGYNISALNQIQAALTCAVQPSSTIPTYGLPPCVPMSDFAFSVVTSFFTLGALGGSSVANLVMDSSGRKGALRITTGCTAAGAALMALSGSVFFLALGRFIIGIGAGIGLCVAPIFISEIAPTRISGSLGILTQLGIVIGIMVTQIVGMQFAQPSQWRYVLVVSSAIAVGQFLASSLIGESPVWLQSKGRLEERKKVAMQIWGFDGYDPLVQEESGERSARITNEASGPTVKVPQLFTSREFRRPLLVVSVAMLAQQISGINAVLYYSNDILSKSLPSLGPYLSLGITVVNFLMTFPPIVLIERMGRRQLLTVSVAGQVLSLVLLGYGLNSGWVTLSSVTILTFVMSFAVGLGPIPFILIPEVSPPQAVSALSSVALSINWTSNFMVGLLFLPVRNVLSGGEQYREGRVFYVFGVLLLVSGLVLSRNYR